MKMVLRVDARQQLPVGPGARVRRGDRIGCTHGRRGEPVLAPVDAFVESILYLAEQQAYILVLLPIRRPELARAGTS